MEKLEQKLSNKILLDLIDQCKDNYKPFSDIDILGNGRLGCLIKIVDISSNIPFAMRIRLLGSNDDPKRPTLISLISEEINLMNKFKGKPHILPLISHVIREDYVLFLFDYCPGGSIRSLNDDNVEGNVDERIIKIATKQILSGLYYLHRDDRPYGRLKPMNILIDKHGELKLSDLSFACRDNDKQETSRSSMSKYLSPEIVNGLPRTTSCDIWSLGVILLELSLGLNKFRPLQILQFNPKKIKKKFHMQENHYTLEMISFLQELFHNNPNDRPNVKFLLKSTWIDTNSNISYNFLAKCFIELSASMTPIITISSDSSGSNSRSHVSGQLIPSPNKIHQPFPSPKPILTPKIMNNSTANQIQNITQQSLKIEQSDTNLSKTIYQENSQKPIDYYSNSNYNDTQNIIQQKNIIEQRNSILYPENIKVNNAFSIDDLFNGYEPSPITQSNDHLSNIFNSNPAQRRVSEAICTDFLDNLNLNSRTYSVDSLTEAKSSGVYKKYCQVFPVISSTTFTNYEKVESLLVSSHKEFKLIRNHKEFFGQLTSYMQQLYNNNNMSFTNINLKDVDQLFFYHFISIILIFKDIITHFVFRDCYAGPNFAHYLSDILICLSNLILLDIGGNNIGDKGIVEISSNLVGLVNLKEINFRGNDISSEGLGQILEYLKKIPFLRNFDISDNNIRDKGFTILCNELIHFPRLVNLVVAKSEIGDDSGTIFSDKLINISQLVKLDISSNNLTDKSGYLIGHSISYLKQLKSLNFSGNRIGITTMNSISNSMKSFPSLLELKLDDNHITRNSSSDFIKKLRKLDSLEYLSLNHFELGHKCFSELVKSFKYLTSLETVKLSGNNSTDSACQDMLKMTQFIPRLKVIHLDNNNIGDQGVHYICKSLIELTKLVEVSLQNNLLTDKSITEIEKLIDNNKTIESFLISGNNFTENQLKYLPKKWNRIKNWGFPDDSKCAII